MTQSADGRRTNLELQLRRVRALDDFALGALRAASPIAILSEAIDLLYPLFTVQAAVAVLYAAADGAPAGLYRTSDRAVARCAAPAALATLPALGRVDRCCLVEDTGPGGASEPIAAIAAWLDEVARPIERDLQRDAHYLRRDAVMLTGRSEPGATRGIIGFRSSTTTRDPALVERADLPFLELICEHVSRSMELAARCAALEQRVEDGGAALVACTAELADSLERLQETQHQLVQASRRAGMSDVATSVLHNVGNVLNSVNVSATLVEQRVASFKVKPIRQVAELIRSHRADLATFFTEDPRGKVLPDYLDQLGQAIDADQAHVVGELASLRRNIDHIKAIVTLQQDVARTSSGIAEPVSIVDLIEDAARFDRTAYERCGVVLERRFESAIPIVSDRHKILQILTNLLSNARHAVSARPADRRTVIVCTTTVGDDHVIEVRDTGCGIASENLGRVFSLGFTTRTDGHGFGLHSSACTAVELGGRLTCESEGVDRGAVFRLTLPVLAASRSPAPRSHRNSRAGGA
jgi:signal transduction histidine kinase